MQVKCPNCGRTVSASQINIQKLVAVCQHCDTLFNIDVDSGITSKPPRKRRKVPQPEKFHVTEEDDSLEITFLTRENLGWLEILLAVFFGAGGLGCLVGAVAAAINGAWIGTIILLPLLVILLYLFASIFVNRAEVRLTDTELTSRELPLRTFFWDKRIDRHEVISAFTQPTGASNNPADDYYSVMLTTVDGLEAKFIDTIQRRHAEFIAQMLNEYLESDSDTRESPFIEDNAAHSDPVRSALADGEVISGEADEDAPVALDDLLRDEQRKNQHRDS